MRKKPRLHNDFIYFVPNRTYMYYSAKASYLGGHRHGDKSTLLLAAHPSASAATRRSAFTRGMHVHGMGLVVMTCYDWGQLFKMCSGSTEVLYVTTTTTTTLHTPIRV